MHATREGAGESVTVPCPAPPASTATDTTQKAATLRKRERVMLDGTKWHRE